MYNVVVRINLYNGLFVQAFVRVCAHSGLPKQGVASHAVVMGYHKDTSPTIIFNLINQEIRAKCVLSWNMWREGDGL